MCRGKCEGCRYEFSCMKYEETPNYEIDNKEELDFLIEKMLGTELLHVIEFKLNRT